MVSVGTIVWLSSELMFFAALFAMYFSIRAASPATGPLSWPYHTEHLDVYYALPFSVILVLSSVTCQIGVFAAERGDVFALRRWFSITFVMGLVFVLGQANEYRMNIHEGFIALVKGRRGAALNGTESTLFSGEYWTGRKAQEMGLVDRIGGLHRMAGRPQGAHRDSREARRPGRDFLAHSTAGRGRREGHLPPDQPETRAGSGLREDLPGSAVAPSERE